MVAWLMEHYKDALCGLAPLGFTPGPKPLEIIKQSTVPDADFPSNIVVRVIPRMPGCQCSYTLTHPYIYRSRKGVQNGWIKEECSYYEWQQLLEDIIRICD